MLTKRLVAGAATAAMSLALLPAAVHAQDILGSIAGNITDAAGKPLANVSVKVTYVPTGQALTTKTNADGFFTLRNLQVGGPYSVVASDGGVHLDKTIPIDHIDLGSPYSVNFALDGGATEVVVKAARTVATSQTQTGPRSTFTAADIDSLPTFARDLKDMARLNPFVTIDPTNSNAIYIAGANPKFTTIYIDGVKQSDDFGLNGNGYPTQRSPISIESVKAFNVEVAPYDVQYGEFQGGVINIVTKNGGNDLHGTVFYNYDGDSLAGHVLGADTVNQPKCANGAKYGTETVSAWLSTTGTRSITCGDRNLEPKFTDRDYGGSLSGAILPDKLFFFVSYERNDSLGPVPYTPAGSGLNPVPGVSAAQVQDVVSILQSKYGYNAGSISAGAPTTNTQYFARIDANITDRHHLFVTYQETDGDTLNFPNGSTSATKGILALSSDYYTYVQDLKAWTADLTSHWTDKLSTELEYTHKTVQSLTQLNSPGTAGLFEIQLQSVNGDQPSIYVGPDVSRQANALATQDDQYKFKTNYVFGDHTFTIGYEHEDTKSYDLFVQNANGTYSFSNGCGSTGYDSLGVPLNLANGQACSLTYANAYNNVAATAGGSETTSIDTGYLQDEWRVLPSLSIKAGVRVESYSVNTSPLLNPNFETQFGFPNNVTLNGDSIVMPRIGFNWHPDSSLDVSGGIGLFSGGDPTVYFYDSFDNPGNLLGSVSLTCKSATLTGCNPSLSNVNINQVGSSAQALNTASALAGAGVVNAVSPDFQVPSDWKTSISVKKRFDFADYGWLGKFGWLVGNDWTLHLDDVYTKVDEGIYWADLLSGANVIGVAPDGRPEFNPARITSTTAPYDIELKNTHKGGGNVIAVGVFKSWASGWDVDLTFTHEGIKEVSPATSTVAASNYKDLAFSNPNSPADAPSDYNIDKQVKLSLNYTHKFIGDNKTTIRLFGEWRTGLPFSYTYESAYPSGTGGYTTSTSGQNFDETFGQPEVLAAAEGELLYVPKTVNGVVTATSDPRVTYAPGFDLAAFNQFLKTTGLIKYAGQISPRNGFESSDYTHFDIELTQEFPAFFPYHAKGVFYFDIFNIGNLLDRNWGVIKQTSFPQEQSPILALNCQPQAWQAAGLKSSPCTTGSGNFYQYYPGSPTTQTLGSTSGGIYYPGWQLKFGIRYKF